MSCCCGNGDSKSERILKGFEKRPAEFGYQLSLPEASVQLRLKLAGKTCPTVSADPGGHWSSVLIWDQALYSLVFALLCGTKDARVAEGVLNSGCCGTFTGLGVVCFFLLLFLGFGSLLPREMLSCLLLSLQPCCS